ncbi:MAG TPA: hypothetical protein VFE76_01330 [Myxococcales bacterium]|nr:hypothetical protein [Myxococcales bacterium]
MDTTPSRWRSRFLYWVAFGVLGAVVAVGLFTWAALNVSYSKGERVGYIQRLSRKGWVCKTWEGELAVATVPGVAPDKFYFSVRTEPIASQVNGTLGKRVRVIYAQHKFIPTSCFGDTEFFVAEAQPVDQ